MFASHKAEKVIIKQINDLTFERIAFRKAEIENAIKWFYWQGTFNEHKYNALNTLLSNKYTELHNIWIAKLNADCERDYKAKMKQYGVEV
jgi:hypothetical protein